MKEPPFICQYPSPLGVLDISISLGGILRIKFSESKNRIYHDCRQVLAAELGLRKMYNFIYDQLNEYFTGQRAYFDLSFILEGTDFQMQVWQELLKIPYGETKTYGDIAKSIGRAGAARAVGQAIHYNPLPIIIPCHRVIGAKGDLVGYAGGLWRKKWLIEQEKKYKERGFSHGQRITFAQ